MNAAGEVVQRAPPFKEELYAVDVDLIDGKAVPRPGHIEPELSEEASVYNALVLGVRDYVSKHRFPGIVLGLSGGIDSALTLAIAVDALGADRVHAVMMPSRYTSQMSLDDAAQQARTLGVRYDVISIEGMFEAALGALKEVFAGRAPDTTEENIQARCRGLLLMAISNKTGRMVLTTGNKSEMAVGYATLVRRHGRRLRADQGLQQDARVSARALSQLDRASDPAARDRARRRRQSCGPIRRIRTRCRRTKCSTRSSSCSSKTICPSTKSPRAASIARRSAACWRW